jgi:hypothetical protein
VKPAIHVVDGQNAISYMLARKLLGASLLKEMIASGDLQWMPNHNGLFVITSAAFEKLEELNGVAQ